MESASFLTVALVFGLLFYFLPFSVALLRLHTGRTKVFFVNLLCGWTAIGWVVAMLMALDVINARKPL